MTQLYRHIVTCLAAALFTADSYGQTWTKQPQSKADSLFAVYSWSVHDSYHSAGGEIILTKSGRFTYTVFRPLDVHEQSGGTYLIKSDKLILTSDLQAGNMKVAINYIDTLTNDTAYTSLSFPQNQKGDTLYSAYYFINGDTSIRGHYDPLLPYNRNLLTSIKSIKAAFYETDYSSAWTPIIQSNKFVKVTLLTYRDLNESSYKVINNWKFRIIGNKLTKLD